MLMNFWQNVNEMWLKCWWIVDKVDEKLMNCWQNDDKLFTNFWWIVDKMSIKCDRNVDELLTKLMKCDWNVDEIMLMNCWQTWWNFNWIVDKIWMISW